MARADSDERLEVWERLLVTHATVLAALERQLERERGLPLSWYEVLLRLERAGGAARMQDLARQVFLSKSGLTRLADRMEQAGLIERRACPSDGRGTEAVLTPVGRSAFRRAAAVHLRGIEAHFSRHVRYDELPVLRAFLDRVLAAESA